MKNTLIFTAGSILIKLPIGLGLALLLNERLRFRKMFRHCVALAASRAACTAGSVIASTTPTIDTTTSNSTIVNPARELVIRIGRIRMHPIRERPEAGFERELDEK